LLKDKLPNYINPLLPLLTKELPTYNHLLINIYPAGIGIMPHFDGPAYRGKVIVLSLGGPSIIHFTDNYKNINKNIKLLLENKSIHIF
jgi:alkylated DNA repair dioxygenase AlkB